MFTSLIAALALTLTAFGQPQTAPTAAPSGQAASVQTAIEIEGMPADVGIYYKSPKGWISLERPQIAGSKDPGLLTSFKSSTKQILRGIYAPFQIYDATPTFYVRVKGDTNPSISVSKLNINTKNQTRELELKVSGAFSKMSAVPGGKIVLNSNIRTVERNLYVVAVSVSPGEYAVYADGDIYEFEMKESH